MANSGIVKTVSGTVKAIASNGSTRLLHKGDTILPNEQVVTDDTGSITIESPDGNLIDLGLNSEMTFSPESVTPKTDAEIEVETIQQALLNDNLDPSELEAPAAGRAPVGVNTANSIEDNGNGSVNILHDLPTRTPDSGFETRGINVQISPLEEDFIQNPDTTALPIILAAAGTGPGTDPESLPTLSINDVSIQEPSKGFFDGSDSYNIVYIIDVSASMRIDDRLADTQQAISALNQSIVDLGIADKTEVAVIPFNHHIPTGDRAPKFFTTADSDANNNNINDIKEYIDGLTPSGGTSFTPPLIVAEDWLNDSARHVDSQNIIFFISDGRAREFDPNNPDIQALYDPNGINAKITAIGIGPTASSEQLDLIDDKNGNNNSSIQVANTPDLQSVLNSIITPDGETGLATAAFTVTLSSVSDQAVTFSFTTADGTAISGGSGPGESDFGARSGSITIPAGETSATIEITIFSDDIPEGDEQFLLTLNNPVNAIIVDGLGTGTILDQPPNSNETDNDFSTVNIASVQQENVDSQTITPILGSNDDDILTGLAGNDILIGGAGSDILTGGSGADIFTWNNSDADGSVDTIVDFNASEGDKINLADILQFNSTNDDISSFLTVSNVEGNATINIDTEGLGNYSDGSIVLDGISVADINVNQLISNGELVVE